VLKIHRGISQQYVDNVRIQHANNRLILDTFRFGVISQKSL